MLTIKKSLTHVDVGERINCGEISTGIYFKEIHKPHEIIVPSAATVNYVYIRKRNGI